MCSYRPLWVIILAGCLIQACRCSLPSHHPRSLHPRHEGKEEEEVELNSEGCSPVNFRSPHHCQPDDCDFSVRWVDSGERVNFVLTAVVEGNPSTAVWAAVGFSEDTSMGGADVVTCLVDSEGHSSIHDGWNIPEQHKHVEDENQTDSSLQLEGDVTVSKQRLTCSFSRQKESGGSAEDKSLSSPLHILVASGQLQQNRMLYHGKERRVPSHCECDFSKCDEICGECSVIIYMLLKLHGVVMCAVFLVLFPTGALVARYYRAVFTEAWFKAHRAVMALGSLGTVIGLGLILGHTGGKFTVGVHQIMGIICICLSVIQPISGLLRPHVGPTVQRRVFTLVHRVLAVTILLLGYAALFGGSYLFHSSVFAWMILFLILSGLVNVAYVGVLEYLTRGHNNFITPPIGYHKVIKESDSEEEEEVYVKEEEPREKGEGEGEEKEKEREIPFRMEKGLLLVFLLQSLSFAVVISVLILKYDSPT